MHTPPAFAEPRASVVLDLVERHNFVALVHALDGDVTVTHVPIFLDDPARAVDATRVEGARFLMHLARANPLCGRLETHPRLTVVCLGPYSYVTPDWYETPGVVPTWNYAAVHLHCDTTSFTDQDRLHDVFDRTARRHEPEVGGAWSRAGHRQDMVDRLIRGVVGYELTVRSHEAMFKFSQNKSDADRRGVSEGLRQVGREQPRAVADLVDLYRQDQQTHAR